MIEVRKATFAHIGAIRPKDIFLDGRNLSARLQNAIHIGPAISFISKDGILAIIGTTDVNPGVVEFWAVTSDLCAEYAFAFHKKVSAFLELIIAVNGLKRVQMVVRHSYAEGVKWATSLGFKVEGLMPKYGPDGDDYYMMGRT